jgi:hypothetical protein
VNPVAAWSATCDPGEVCIYQNSNFGGEVAGDNTVEDVYSGHYPGSSVNINDSASSLKNYTSKDMVWYHEFYQTGANDCLDSQSIWSWIGLIRNDAYSSHETSGVDTLC